MTVVCSKVVITLLRYEYDTFYVTNIIWKKMVNIYGIPTILRSQLLSLQKIVFKVVEILCTDYLYFIEHKRYISIFTHSFYKCRLL